MKIGLLILHYNTPEITSNLCKMVPDAIVIDNGSPEPFKSSNRIIRFETNYGFTKGWNKAIKKVYNEFDAFWLMNSDIQINKESIERITKLLDFPEISMLTPSYNCWIKDIQNKDTKGVREIKTIEFTAPVIKKSVFEKIGFFDEQFTLGYGIEFDFCFRMRQAGLKIFVDDASSFIHLGQQTINKNGGIVEYSRKANFELIHGLLNKYEDWHKIIPETLDLKKNFPMNIAVYTSIFGDFNELKKIPEQTIKADYYCITDNSAIKAPGWQTIVVEYPRKDLCNRLRAKFYKIFPWEVEEIASHQISIYIDGSIQIQSSSFIEYCIKNLSNDMLLYKHPQRNCIYKERIASNQLKKYKEELIDLQIANYKKFYPPENGLYACGVLVRKHTDFIKKLMHDWWFECIKYSYQDQISFPVICHLNNFKPTTFKENQYNNDYFKIFWHDDGVKDSDIKRKINNEKLTVSVLMPIYATPLEYIKEAAKSILRQTYKDFEFLIVNDNNADGRTLSYFKNLRQIKNIKIIDNNENKGIANALNIGLKNCKGDIIIRMDADDIAFPCLIQKHLNFYANNPDAIICGVQIKAFGSKNFTSHHPAKVDREYALKIPGHWLINHPGISYKRDIILKLGGYGNILKNQGAEDYELWCRVLKAGFEIYNMPDVLISYRLGNRPERKTEEWLAFLEKCKSTLYE